MNSRQYWLDKEKELSIQWELAMSASPLKWIERAFFWKKYYSSYESKGYYLINEVYVPCYLYDLRLRIKKPPVFSPCEEDFSGPVERWYGIFEESIFTLTYYYGGDGNITYLKTTDINTAKLQKAFDAFLNIYPFGAHTKNP